MAASYVIHRPAIVAMLAAGIEIEKISGRLVPGGCCWVLKSVSDSLILVLFFCEHHIFFRKHLQYSFLKCYQLGYEFVFGEKNMSMPGFFDKKKRG